MPSAIAKFVYEESVFLYESFLAGCTLFCPAGGGTTPLPPEERRIGLIPCRRSAQLAVQASLLLALEPPGASRRVRDIAATLDVPASYLVKVLQNLTRAGLLRSVRGPGGGVRLAPSAREVRLWDVLAAVGPVSEYERCILGLDDCSDTNPCPLHELWAPVRDGILQKLRSLNLWEFADAAKRKGLLPGDPAARHSARSASSSPPPS